jgi:hypothetical protein
MADSPYKVPPEIEARRINEILLGRGMTQVEANQWWYTSNARLGGRTPNELWLSADTPTEAIIEIVRNAAFEDSPH